jgi:hypothetical protein
MWPFNVYVAARHCPKVLYPSFARPEKLLCSGIRKPNTIQTIRYEEIHVVGIDQRVRSRMSDTAGHASKQSGTGRADSSEPGAIRYELFVGIRTGSVDERKSTVNTGDVCFRLRSTAPGIHSWCDRLRDA